MGKGCKRDIVEFFKHARPIFSSASIKKEF